MTLVGAAVHVHVRTKLSQERKRLVPGGLAVYWLRTVTFLLGCTCATTTSHSRRKSAPELPTPLLSLRNFDCSRCRYDKQLLPKAMQLRRGEFGKKGQVAGLMLAIMGWSLCSRSGFCAQVKHSHLTDVDTTDMSAAWAQSSKIVQRRQPECEKLEILPMCAFFPAGTRKKWRLQKGWETSNVHP